MRDKMVLNPIYLTDVYCNLMLSPFDAFQVNAFLDLVNS